MRNKTVLRLSIDSMMAALYFVLAYFSIRLGNNLTISLGSLVIVLTSLLFDPLDSICVALIGESINQLAKYGISITTGLWLIPPLVRALTISITAYIYKKKGYFLEDKKVAYFLTIIIAALFTTACNSGIIIVDAMLLDYPSSFTLVSMGFRFLSSFITSIVVSIIAILIIKPLRKALRYNPSIEKTKE